MSEVQFDQNRMQQFERTVAKYEQKASALLPVLYLAQEQFGFLSPQVIVYVAKLLDMPPARVFEAVSFYFLFKTKDMGKYCLQVCDNITCHMMGAGDLIRTAKKKLGISVGEVTEDKRFSLKVVQCLGACDKAPVAQVNSDYVNELNEEKLEMLLSELAREGSTTPVEATTS